MAEELSLDSLKDMKKAEFIMAFKDKAAWRKAKAVIVLADYKLEGKKFTVAIPFKKENEMKAEMKRLKKEKLHLLKKSGGGLISIENDGPEGLKAKIELTVGGLKPEMLQLKAEELFDRIKAKLEVVIAENAELEDVSGEYDEEEAGAEKENPTAAVNSEDVKQKPTPKVDLQALAKEIISQFKAIQTGFNGASAIVVFKKISSWINAYKLADEQQKQTFKEAAESLQKIAVYLKNAIQIDQAIDKEIEPLYKEIDKHNELVERGNPAAAAIKDKILASFDKISKMATEIKDSGLAAILAEFKSQLK